MQLVGHVASFHGAWWQKTTELTECQEHIPQDFRAGSLGVSVHAGTVTGPRWGSKEATERPGQ